MKLAIVQIVLGILIVVDFLSFGLLSGIEAGGFPPFITFWDFSCWV